MALQLGERALVEMAGRMNTPTHEVGESVEADFEKLTWTFRINTSCEVGAGFYGIVMLEKLMDMLERLKQAEGILARINELENPMTIGATNYEAVQRYFDPKP